MSIEQTIAEAVVTYIREHKDALRDIVTPALMDIRKAAEYLGMSEETLRHMIEDGEMPHIRGEKRRIRLARTDLDGWINKNRIVAK